MAKGVNSKRSNGKEGWATLNPQYKLDIIDDKRSLLDLHILADSLLKSSNFPNVWADIIGILEPFDLTLDLVTPREVDGKYYCFSEYLHYLALNKKSAKLKAAADMVNALLFLEIALHLRWDVSKQLNEFYRLSCNLKVSQLEDQILAGQSRTGEATHSRKQQGKKNKAEALEMARTIKQSNHRLSKKDLARQIAKVMPLKEKTIYKYLTE